LSLVSLFNNYFQKIYPLDYWGAKMVFPPNLIIGGMCPGCPHSLRLCIYIYIYIYKG